MEFAPSEHFGGKFNPECDGFKMHCEMGHRAYEVHSGGLAHIFVLCQCFIRVEFIVSVESVIEES